MKRRLTLDSSIITIKYVDLQQDKAKQYLVGKEENQYLGHPDSVMLDDCTIYTFYPKNHWRGPIVYRSKNKGVEMGYIHSFTYLLFAIMKASQSGWDVF